MSHFKVPASDYMNAPVITIRRGVSANSAEQLLDEHGITAVGVTDDTGKLIGVLSRTDLLKAASGASGANFEVPGVPVVELMSPTPETVDAEAPLDAVAKAMKKNRFHRIFVQKSDRLAGVISTRDIMRAVFDKRIDRPASEIATTSVVRVRPDDTIALAVERLELSNRHGLIVTDGRWPVGTFGQTEALLSRARDPRTHVEEVMETRMLALPSQISLHRAARQALAMGVRRMVLVGEQSIEGIVSSFDFCRVVAD